MVTPANWMNGASASGFYDPANVILDDSGSATPAINLVTTVTPRSITVNSAQNYSISGFGEIGSVPGLTNALIKNGSGTLSLDTANDFSGGVNILAGTLKVGSASAIPSGVARGNVSVAGTLDLNGNSITLNGLSGAGIVDNQSGSGIYTLTLGANDSSGTFSGVVRNTSGTVALSKTGSGTLTLSGNNTFSGAVTISDGALRVSHGNALGSTAGNTTIAGAASLGRLEVTGGITVNDDLALAMKFGIGSGSKDPQVPHVQNISGDNTLNGTFTLNSGGTFWTFQSDAGKLTINKTLSASATGGRPILLQGAGDGEIKGSIQNGSGQVALVKSGSGTWTLSGTNTYGQSTTINAGTLKLGGSNAIPSGVGKGDVAVDGTLDLNGNSITINGLSGSGTVDNATGAAIYGLSLGDNNRSGTFLGVIKNTSGTLAVSKIGTGTITLSGANLYGGDTTISQGTLKLGASNVLPDGSGKGNVIVNGTLDLSGNSDTINGLSGSGTVDNSAGGSPTLTVGNNNVSSALNGVIGGGFVSLIKIGGGTLTLNGNNTYTGNTTVNAGTLLVNGHIDSASVVVNSTATLGGTGVISGSVVVQIGATLSPGASIGTLTLSDSLTLSGNTVMEINKTGGTLTGDLVQGVSTLTYGGTLTVTASGNALAENDSFNLFDATTFAGSFATLTLPSLPACLVWDTSKLTVDGTIKVTHETVKPVIGTITATEVQSGTVNVKDCVNSTLQGTVNISVQASDNCALAGSPTVTLTNGATTQSAAFVNESPTGTFNYTWAVTSGTAAGTWTAKVIATDTSGNAATNSFTLCVAQQNQVTGQVEPQGFVGTNRAVTFVVTSSSNTPLLTNTLTLTFAGSPRVASYSLSVPLNAANLSAKTAWTLRKRLPLTFSSGQAVANFTGTNRLLGGDINGNNNVNSIDNNVFKSFNGKTVATTPAAAQADITGNGSVNSLDFNVLKANLGKVGEAQ
jgi:autotransporter-associated beta strand protein